MEQRSVKGTRHYVEIDGSIPSSKLRPFSIRENFSGDYERWLICMTTVLIIYLILSLVFIVHFIANPEFWGRLIGRFTKAMINHLDADGETYMD